MVPWLLQVGMRWQLLVLLLRVIILQGISHICQIWPARERCSMRRLVAWIHRVRRVYWAGIDRAVAAEAEGRRGSTRRGRRTHCGSSGARGARRGRRSHAKCWSVLFRRGWKDTACCFFASVTRPPYFSLPFPHRISLGISLDSANASVPRMPHERVGRKTEPNRALVKSVQTIFDFRAVFDFKKVFLGCLRSIAALSF
jgi:hypothetical protein